jgi:hypothetical protein
MRVAAVAVSILLGACIARGAGAAEPIEVPEGEPYLHPSSGFRFPADVGTFTRVSAYRYDDDGRDVSVGYSDRGLKVILTAYVYPNRGQSLLRHFEQVKHDLRQINPAAEPASEGAWELEQNGRKFTGRRAKFEFRLKVGEKERDVVSEAYLLRLGDNFVKFRVTCPKEKYEAAEERVERFLQSLKLPASPPVPAAAPVPAR